MANHELLLRIKRRDPPAFAELYRRWIRHLIGRGRRMRLPRPDSEEVANEALLRVYQVANRYDEKRSPLGWILTIHRNLAINRLRSLDREVPIYRPQDDEIIHDIPEPPSEETFTKLPNGIGGAWIKADESDRAVAFAMSGSTQEEMNAACGKWPRGAPPRNQNREQLQAEAIEHFRDRYVQHLGDLGELRGGKA